MFGFLRSYFSNDLAIDLGTANTLIYVRDKGIVLDEPSANIDEDTDAVIQAALRSAFAGATVLVVAHRLSTIRDADVIVVCDAGRVAERGTHAELLARGGADARLVSRAEPAAEPAAGDAAAEL